MPRCRQSQTEPKASSLRLALWPRKRMNRHLTGTITSVPALMLKLV